MKQTNIYTLALAALMLIPASCSDEQYTAALAPGQQPGNGASGPLITVTATQGARPQTRLGYDVPSDPTQPIEVTWAAADHFYIGKDFSAFTSETPLSLSVATAYFSPLTIKEGDAGKKNAEFTGNLPTFISNDAPLYAIYGDGTTRIALNGAQQGAQQGTEQQGTLSFDYTNQRQTANNDKTHLSAADFMVATTTYKTGKQPVLIFTHLGAMMKFNLTLPATGIKVKQLTLTSIDGTTPFSDVAQSDVAQWNKTGEALAFSKSKTPSASTTLLLGNSADGEQVGITLEGNQLTAYMMVAPTSLTNATAPITNKTLELKVTDTAGVVYIATLKGADIEQGKYYTVGAVMEAYDEMSFTIRIDNKFISDQNFKIPFQNKHTFTARTTVNWGDGQTTVVEVGEQFGDLSHEYATTGDYTITISSAQSDATKQQIPNIYFYHDSNSSSNGENAAKIISFNTPMLNMGESLGGCLYNCVNLVSLPGDLLKKNTLATNFYECFFGCKKLQALPADLFKENTQATSFEACFLGCTSLKELPAGLFDKNTKVETFYGCFCMCSALETLPENLFANNTLVNDFTWTFALCEILKELPAGLFRANSAVTTFKQTFENCTALASLPTGLFDKNTKVETFYECFYKCTSLKELPTGLFDKNTKVETFYGCFKECTALVTLPVGLFDNNTLVNNFSYCFNGCTSLKELPVGLFDNNTLVSTFNYCFNGCTSLKELPAGLFDNNTLVSTFNYCFNGCTSLKELPAGLFDKNTEANYFRSCFKGCTNLASLPEGLFHHNTNVSDYFACFKECSNLVLNEKIFCSAETPNERNSHFLKYTFKLNFNECFYNTGSALTDEQKATSVAPELWNGKWNAKKPTKDDCFTGCKASNLADKISSWEWGAPAN